MRRAAILAMLLVAGCASTPAEPLPAKGLYTDYEDYLFKGRAMYGVQYYRDRGVPDEVGIAYLHCFWQAEQARLRPADVEALNAFARGEAEIPETVKTHISTKVVPEIRAQSWDALRPYCADKIDEFKSIKFN